MPRGELVGTEYRRLREEERELARVRERDREREREGALLGLSRHRWILGFLESRLCPSFAWKRKIIDICLFGITLSS